MMEAVIKDLYQEWGVDKHLSEEEYAKLVFDTYQVLVENAKASKTIFYGELPAFNELKERFGDTASKLIGSIIGACSEYEALRGRPLISSIVISRDTHESGGGFYKLSAVPLHLCTDTWEEQDVRPPDIVLSKRQEFWLTELQETLEYWAKQEN